MAIVGAPTSLLERDKYDSLFAPPEPNSAFGPGPVVPAGPTLGYSDAFLDYFESDEYLALSDEDKYRLGDKRFYVNTQRPVTYHYGTEYTHQYYIFNILRRLNADLHAGRISNTIRLQDVPELQPKVKASKWRRALILLGVWFAALIALAVAISALTGPVTDSQFLMILVLPTVITIVTWIGLAVRHKQKIAQIYGGDFNYWKSQNFDVRAIWPVLPPWLDPLTIDDGLAAKRHMTTTELLEANFRDMSLSELKAQTIKRQTQRYHEKRNEAALREKQFIIAQAFADDGAEGARRYLTKNMVRMWVPASLITLVISVIATIVEVQREGLAFGLSIGGALVAILLIAFVCYLVDLRKNKRFINEHLVTGRYFHENFGLHDFKDSIHVREALENVPPDGVFPPEPIKRRSRWFLPVLGATAVVLLASGFVWGRGGLHMIWWLPRFPGVGTTFNNSVREAFREGELTASDFVPFGTATVGEEYSITPLDFEVIPFESLTVADDAIGVSEDRTFFRVRATVTNLGNQIPSFNWLFTYISMYTTETTRPDGFSPIIWSAWPLDGRDIIAADNLLGSKVFLPGEEVTGYFYFSTFDEDFDAVLQVGTDRLLQSEPVEYNLYHFSHTAGD